MDPDAYSSCIKSNLYSIGSAGVCRVRTSRPPLIPEHTGSPYAWNARVSDEEGHGPPHLQTLGPPQFVLKNEPFKA